MLQRLKSLFLLSGNDLQEKALAFLCLCICVELVLFKFLPDLSTGLIQGGTSSLTDFEAFNRYYLTPGSVHYARFLGSRIMSYLALVCAPHIHSQDVRLHPLRIAAGLLTPLYAYAGAILAVQSPGQYSWRNFLVPYCIVAVMGLYVFYPGDMPSFALLSLTLYFLLREQLGVALLFLLLTGLFRESSLHAVFFSFVWAVCARSRPITTRIGWVVAFTAAFGLEYIVIRHFFKGPVSSSGGIILDPRRLLLERGMWSLTTICSLGLAIVVVLWCLVRIRVMPRADWRYWFFRLNCYSLPFWVVFYRSLSGNISEFRMLWPVLLPCIYGIAYAARDATDGVARSAEL